MGLIKRRIASGVACVSLLIAESGDVRAGGPNGSSGKGGVAGRGGPSTPSGDKSSKGGGSRGVVVRGSGMHLSATFTIRDRPQSSGPQPRTIHDPSRNERSSASPTNRGDGPTGRLAPNRLGVGDLPSAFGDGKESSRLGQFGDDKDRSPIGWGTDRLGATGSFEPATGLDRLTHPLELPAKTPATRYGPSLLTGINPRAHQRELDGVLGDAPGVIEFNFDLFVLGPRNRAKLGKAVALEQPLIAIGVTEEFDVYMETNLEGEPIDFVCLEKKGVPIWHSPRVVKLPGTVSVSRYRWAIGPLPPATPDLQEPLNLSPSTNNLVPAGPLLP